MEWIDQNKEWLFQGIGVTALTLLAWLLRRYWPTISRGTVRPSAGTARSHGAPYDSFTQIAPLNLDGMEARLWRQMGVESKPSISSMLRELKTAPLMHKASRAKELEGVVVSARAKLYEIGHPAIFFDEESDKGLVELSFHVDCGGRISCIVKAGKYPDLQVAKRDDDYWIVGVVKRASYYHAELSPSVIAKIT